MDDGIDDFSSPRTHAKWYTEASRYMNRLGELNMGRFSRCLASFASLASALLITGTAIASDDLPSMAVQKVGRDIYVIQGQASVERVKVVVVSHYHADHFYGIQARPILESS